jgi:hypothetical protein
VIFSPEACKRAEPGGKGTLVPPRLYETMAETVAIVGIVAAAAQFSQIAYKVILEASSLLSRFQGSPKCLQRTLDHVQLLLHLAELTKTKLKREPSTSVALMPQLSLDDELQALPPVSTSPLSWLETVWQNCTTQAQELDRLISSMLHQSRSDGIRGVWNRRSMVRTEDKINPMMKEIESYKSLLCVWFGEECLDQISHLKKDMFDLRVEAQDIGKTIAQFNCTLQELVQAGMSDSSIS